MAHEVLLLLSFQDRLKDSEVRSHLKITFKLIKKLETAGMNALKILDLEDHYLLCEMKVMKPPYRLYVVADQKSGKFYVVAWEHKERQEKIINQLKSKLALAINFSLEKIFR